MGVSKFICTVMSRNTKIAIIVSIMVILLCSFISICGFTWYYFVNNISAGPSNNNTQNIEIIDEDPTEERENIGKDTYFPGAGKTEDLTEEEARLKAESYLKAMGDNYISVGNKRSTTKLIYIGTTMQVDTRLIIPELERNLDLSEVEIRYVHAPCPYCNPRLSREDVYSDIALYCAENLDIYLPFRKELLKANTPGAYTDYPAVVRKLTGSENMVDQFNDCYNGDEALEHVKSLSNLVREWHSFSSNPTVVVILDGMWFGVSYGVGTYELLGEIQQLNPDLELFSTDQERDIYKRAVLLLTLYEIKKSHPYGSQLPTTLEQSGIESQILGEEIQYTPSSTGYKLSISMSDGTRYEMEDIGYYR